MSDKHNSGEVGEMHLENPESKCDELQYTIDRLVKEATMLKAFNATQFCHKLPEKVRDTLRSEARNRVDKNLTSKAKIKEVKLFITRQKKARDAADDAGKPKKKGQTMQPPQTVRRANNSRKGASAKEYSNE